MFTAIPWFAGLRMAGNSGASIALGLIAFAGQASAVTGTQYQLAPRDLGSGFTLAGSITTDGTLGTLGAANLTAWDLRVTEIVDTVYTQADTRNVSASVTVADGHLVLPTSPDGSTDGGSLAFTGGRRFGVQVADFSGANVLGGQAFYVNGAAFDFLPLHQPNSRDYVAATLVPGSVTQFALKPLNFSGNVQLTGTVTTDGAVGAAHLLAWDLRVRQTTTWQFDQHSSTVLADLGLTADSRTLTVTPFDADQNAGSFVIGVQGRFDTTAVVLADYLQDPAGQAGLITPFVYQTVSGLPLDPGGQVVVATSVPEPEAWALMLAGLAVLPGICRQRSRVLGPDRQLRGMHRRPRIAAHQAGGKPRMNRRLLALFRLKGNPFSQELQIGNLPVPLPCSAHATHATRIAISAHYARNPVGTSPPSLQG